MTKAWGYWLVGTLLLMVGGAMMLAMIEFLFLFPFGGLLFACGAFCLIRAWQLG